MLIIYSEEQLPVDSCHDTATELPASGAYLLPGISVIWISLNIRLN